MIKEGNKFATRIVLGRIKFKPTQKIRIFPTKEIEFKISVVTYLEMNIARTVTSPCNKPTGIKENKHPFPKEEVINIMIIKSNIALASNTE